MNLFDTLTFSPLCLHRKYIEATNENLNFEVGFKGLCDGDGDGDGDGNDCHDNIRKTTS